MRFDGKTVLITGASRGIGKAIGLRAARDGANIVVLGKTAEPHARLPPVQQIGQLPKPRQPPPVPSPGRR